MKCTSLSISALTSFSKMDAPHTMLLNYTPTYVHNLYETPVTSDQILGRSMIKCFTVASAFAKRKHGVGLIYLVFVIRF